MFTAFDKQFCAFLLKNAKKFIFAIFVKFVVPYRGRYESWGNSLYSSL